jgi:ParB family chromosome partitioning protein
MIDALDAQDAAEDFSAEGHSDAEAGAGAQVNKLTAPLDRLRPGGAFNVRTEYTKAEIASLAASILHQQQLAPLIVAPDGNTFLVGAGNRRLRAFQLLQKQGKIKKTHPVWIELTTKEHLREISLTENVQRVALHPVDEFEAFEQLVQDGATISAIADRFGLTEREVRQRLALGKLAPEIREAWRKGKIGQAQAEVFTLAEDHQLQRRAFKESVQQNGYFNEHRAKEVLRGERLRAESREFRFVGREAYLSAGGRLTENLFKDESLVEDPKLALQLADEKLAAVCQALVAEAGWSFAKTDSTRSGYGTLDLLPFATPEEKALLTGKNKFGHEAWQARHALHARVAELPEARARSGVLVSISYDGEVELATLQVMLSPGAAEATGDYEDDDELSTRPLAGEEGGAQAETAPEIEHGLSKAMEERLSEQLGQAVAQCLVGDVDLALAATVAGLTSGHWGNPFKIRLDGSPARKPAHTDAAFRERLAACVQMDRHALLTELGRAIGGALNITSTSCGIDTKLATGRDELIGAMDADAFQQAVLDVFNPEEFFAQAPGKIAKAAALEAKAETIHGKKDELAAAAATIARETGWLPGPLRTVHYDAPAGGAA